MLIGQFKMLIGQFKMLIGQFKMLIGQFKILITVLNTFLLKYFSHSKKKLTDNLTIKLGIFSDFWRRAAHRRQKSKKMLNENLAFFPIFGGVLRTAAKNRKKCLKNQGKSVREIQSG